MKKSRPNAEIIYETNTLFAFGHAPHLDRDRRGATAAIVDLAPFAHANNWGRKSLIRLRHPERKKIVRVEVNGRPWTNFNAAAEQVSLPTGEREVRVRAYFK